MNIVIDSNIVFSAILNTNNTIGQILLGTNQDVSFYSTEYLQIEIENHRNKIKEVSGLSDQQVQAIIQKIYQKIHFVRDALIPFPIWIEAARLLRDIDMDDTPFVATALYLDANLWTGDKVLSDGLNSKGFERCINTQQLVAMLA